MGLDMYAYTASRAGQSSEWWANAQLDPDLGDFVNTSVSRPVEIAYWRKHPHLHGWMEQLWQGRSNPGPDAVFNGIELGDYTTPSTSPRENAIFFIGRHEERKGLSNLLEALAKLPPDVRLWIASDGPQTAELKIRFASDTRIDWLGRISDAEKISRMSRASVFCAPSLHGESFGVVLLEAMAAGTPVVASNLDGYRNVATDDETALLVETGNVESLASALARVLVDSRLAARLTANGREHAQRFSMDALADRYIEMYERALHMEATNITTIKVPRMLKRFEGRFLRRSHLGDGR